MKGNKVETYELPYHEKHLYHIKMQMKGFDPHTGEKMHKPYISKFNVKRFNQMNDGKRDHLASYWVEVLHDPTIDGSKESNWTSDVTGLNSEGEPPKRSPGRRKKQELEN